MTARPRPADFGRCSTAKPVGVLQPLPRGTRAQPDDAASHADDTDGRARSLRRRRGGPAGGGGSTSCERLLLGMAFDRDGDCLANTRRPQPPPSAACPGPNRTGVGGCAGERVEATRTVAPARVRVTQLLVSRLLRRSGADGPHGAGDPPAVVLASGGGGHLFDHQPRPGLRGALPGLGSGSLGRRLEFVQFHPTALRLDDAPCFPIRKPYGVREACWWSPGRQSREQLPCAILPARSGESGPAAADADPGWTDVAGLRSDPAEKVEARFPTILIDAMNSA